MKYIVSTILLGLFFTTMSCGGSNKKFVEGSLNENTYTSKEVGWTIDVPEGWEIINRLENATAKDIEEMKALGNTNVSGLKYLIGFRKDQLNTFQSTTEPFNPEAGVTWDENNAKLRALTYDAFVEQKVKIDTASTKEKIDGLEFDVFVIKAYSNADNKIMFIQEMYSREINGLYFGINISYNSKELRKTMFNALKNSKFNKN
ncbi:MAG: hypothetical protein ACK5IQ_01675 [Bacteroidales bacterium]